MINNKGMRLTKLAFALSLAIAAVPAMAQNTTSAIGGQIMGADGQPASGAQVTIVHTESGSVSSAVTDNGGRYVARGLRPGGPYTITITKNGVTEKREGVYLNLAETASLDAKLGGSVQTVTITGQSAAAAERFNKSNMGAASSLSRTELDAQFSIQRNLQDYARIDPRVSQTDKERGEMSVAGQNSRFNSMTVDGVSISDTFGLEANGMPTARQPIPLDAIQSVQVNVSNYDVTQKGYTGANVNAITKSGTNEFKGSGYYVFRNDSMVGKKVNSNETYFDAAPFKETTKGATFGGPIIKDKLFFFTAYEKSSSSRATPAFGPLGSSGTNVGITQSAIASANAIAAAKYPGYVVGSMDAAPGAALETKDLLVKLDWNINDNHRASLRYDKLDQNEPLFSSQSTSAISLNSSWYNQIKSVESTVAQVFSDWTPHFSTEAKYSLRKTPSAPTNATTEPYVGLQFTGALPAGTPSSVSSGSRFLDFGTDNSRQLNVLNTKTTDLYLAGNWQKDAHEFKFGLDYSKNEIYNAFLQNTYGNYTFGCVDSSATYTYSFGAIKCSTATNAQIEQAVLENFSIGRPSAYTLQVPADGKTLNDAIAQFTLKNTGLFLQDTWTVSPKFSIMYGVRYDRQGIGGRPTANTAAAAPMVAGSVSTNAAGVATYVRNSGGFGLDNTVTIDGASLVQPRVGFNYSLDTALPTQIRGGVGLFQGAAENVWLSNGFSNTGVATRIINCSTSSSPNCPSTGGLFSTNPFSQPILASATPAANVDFVQNGLGQPSVLKANLAWEQQLPFAGMVFSVEYLYTNMRSAMYYQHLNLGGPTAIGKDGRQLFWTQQGYNNACWSTTGTSTSSGAACTGLRSKALSNPNYNNVLQATKTDNGGGNLATISLGRPLQKGWGWSFSYTYTDATNVSDLSSSVSNSSWQSRAIVNPNEDVAANSGYLVKDRFNAMLTWQQKFFGDYKTTVGAFYEGRRGKPYSWTFKNDLNGDGISGNDLMYIPSAPQSGQVVFLGDTATSHPNEDRFWSVVNSNKALAAAMGGLTQRNSAFSPWTNSIDMRISQEIPGFYKKNKAVFTLDFQNVGNMINKKWGRIDEVPFSSSGGQQRSFVAYNGLDAQGRYIYSVLPTVDSLVTRQVKGESQWAIQATVKYEF